MNYNLSKLFIKPVFLGTRCITHCPYFETEKKKCKLYGKNILTWSAGYKRVTHCVLEYGK